ncbi:LOW QUALITY PROTEIN: ribonuclease SLFN12-like [Mergus octosetaceus]
MVKASWVDAICCKVLGQAGKKYACKEGNTKEKKPKSAEKNGNQQKMCALLINSGGSVVKAEIENEDYSLQRDEIRLDLHETFRSLLLSADLAKYLDFKQCGASLSHMTLTEAILFLEEKQDEARRELSPGTPAKKSNTSDVEEDMDIVNDTVAELFNRDQLRYRETLNFTESADVEFKHYSTDNFLKRVKEILPQYISGFANACGGYLWIGVDDDRRVQGFRCDDKDLVELRHLITKEYKLKVFHFCNRGYEHSIRCKHKIFKVYDEAGEHRGYVCAVKIEPFTCAVFAKDPESWQVEGPF